MAKATIEALAYYNPRSIDISRSFFTVLLGRVTHQAIELIHRKLIGVKQ